MPKSLRPLARGASHTSQPLCVQRPADALAVSTPVAATGRFVSRAWHSKINIKTGLACCLVLEACSERRRK